jgi:hypothetical protein
VRRPLVHRLSAIPSFRRYPSSISVTVAPPSLGFFLPRLGSARSAEGNSVGLVANERDCSIVPAQVPSDDKAQLVLGDRPYVAAVIDDLEDFVGEIFNLPCPRQSVPAAKFLIASEPAAYRGFRRHPGVRTDGPKAFTVEEPKAVAQTTGWSSAVCVRSHFGK